MVILNKVDLAGPGQVQKVKKWIDDQMNRVRVVEASHCDVPLEILLSVGRFDPAKLAQTEDEHDHSHDHGQDFTTWSYETDRPFSLEALKEMVKRKLPASVYRCKGVVYTADAPEHRAVLQVVGRRTDVTLLDEWNGRTPRTRIVAIGVAGGIDGEALREQFDSCLCHSSNEEAGHVRGTCI